MRKLGLLIMALAVCFTVNAQTSYPGQFTEKYWFSGSLSVGQGLRNAVADPSSVLQVGTDSSNKGIMFPKGNPADVPNPNNKSGIYIHNPEDDGLYKISASTRVKLFDQDDTAQTLSTKYFSSNPANINQDSTHSFISYSERDKWNLEVPIGSAIPTTVPINSPDFHSYVAVRTGTFTNFKDATNTSILVSSADSAAGEVILYGQNNIWGKIVRPAPLGNYYTKNQSDVRRDSTYNALPYNSYTIVPRDKTGETYPSPSVLTPSSMYWETANKIGGGRYLSSVTFYAQNPGWARLFFIDTIGSTSYPKYTIAKYLQAGKNVIEAPYLYIPDSVQAMPEIFVGVSNYDANSSPMVYTATNGTAARLSSANGGAISNFTLSLSMGITTTDKQPSTLEKLPATISYQQQLANYSLTGTPEVTPYNRGPLTFGTVPGATHYYCDTTIYLGRKKLLQKLMIKAGIAGDVTIVFGTITGNAFASLHTITRTLTVGLNGLTPTDLSLPDFSAYEKVYIFIGNTVSSPFRYAPTGGPGTFVSMNKTTGALTFSAAAFQFGYWIEDLNTTNKLFDRIADVEAKIPVANRIKTYAQLLAACSIPGNYVQILNDTIDVPNRIQPANGVSIVGIGNASLLRMSDTNTQGIFNMQVRSDWKIKNLVMEGEFADVGVGMNDTTYIRYVDGVRSIDDIVNRRGVGTSVGILIGSSERYIIENVLFKNFSRAGVDASATGNLSPRLSQGGRGQNLMFESCYMGMYFHDQAEYSQYSQISAKYCVIGYYKSSGNLGLTGSQLVHCIAGYVSDSGNNDSHGNASSLQINHSHPYAIICNGISGGETFGSLTMFDGTIYVRNSNGVNINGANISTGNIVIDGGGNGWNSVTCSMFRWNTATIVKLNGAKVIRGFNYYRNHDDHSSLND